MLGECGQNAAPRKEFYFSNSGQAGSSLFLLHLTLTRSSGGWNWFVDQAELLWELPAPSLFQALRSSCPEDSTSHILLLLIFSQAPFSLALHALLYLANEIHAPDFWWGAALALNSWCDLHGCVWGVFWGIFPPSVWFLVGFSTNKAMTWLGNAKSRPFQ